MAKKKATKKAVKKTTKKAATKKTAMKKAASAKTMSKAMTKTISKDMSKDMTKDMTKDMSKTATKKAAAPKKKRTLNPALKAPYTPSTQLAEIVGASAIPRQEVVSKLWKYIKKNGLQDKQNIHADDKLKPIFGKKVVTMFEMQKHISKHLTKA